jgi:hypothetical protein
VQFGTTQATVDVWSDTQIVARAPAGLSGPVTVRVATSQGTSNGLPFTYLSAAQTQIGNDGAAGYSTTGMWRSFTGQGYLNNVQESLPTDPPSAATWQFTGLASGQYRVSATWSPGSNRATNAPYSINGGAPILVNQRQSPNDFVDGGAGWRDLGIVDLAGNTLTVRLANTGANGSIIADAIRIERIDEVSTPLSPTLASLAPSQALAGAAVTLTGTNFGTQQGTGSVQFGGIATTVDVWSDTQIVARAPAGLSGPVTVRVATSEGLSNGLPFTYVSTSQIGNDGAAGYSTTGTWRPFTGQGYLNNVQESRPADPPSVATWQFTGLASGQYRVSATWSPYANRATNAPYSINGGAPILVNQQQSPNDRFIEGAGWHDLGIVDLAGNTLTVQLANTGTNGSVIADAIRIERIG